MEGNGFCAIYDTTEEYFKFVCTRRLELETILATRFLQMKVLEENERRFCSQFGNAMQEGYYFESILFFVKWFLKTGIYF